MWKFIFLCWNFEFGQLKKSYLRLELSTHNLLKKIVYNLNFNHFNFKTFNKRKKYSAYSILVSGNDLKLFLILKTCVEHFQITNYTNIFISIYNCGSFHAIRLSLRWKILYWMPEVSELNKEFFEIKIFNRTPQRMFLQKYSWTF